MHATVVVFPGSNADAEMIHTLRDVVGMSTTTVAWHKDAELPAGTDLVAIPGGFSYGDYLRCGAIAKVSPIMRRHPPPRRARRLGARGLQRLPDPHRGRALAGRAHPNPHLRFECRDVFVTPVAEGPFTTGSAPVLRLPIAHAEGRYQADEATLRELERRGRASPCATATRPAT